MVDDDKRRWLHINPEIPEQCVKIFELEKFDATFFGVNFKQSQTLDPQLRILMETAYEAVTDVGINPASLQGTKTGVENWQIEFPMLLACKDPPALWTLPVQVLCTLCAMVK